MQKKIYIFLFLLVAAIVGMIFYPSSVQTTIIPADYKLWDKSLSKVMYSLEINERQLLKGYLDRHNPEVNENAKIDIPVNLSIEQAIKLQRIYLETPEAQKKIANEKSTEQYSTIKSEILNSLFIGYISKQNENEKVIITYAYKNKTVEDITAFEGTMTYVDNHATIIDKKIIKSQKLVPANSMFTYSEIYTKDNINNFDIIKGLTTHQLDCQIVITSITFKSGKKIVLPMQEQY